MNPKITASALKQMQGKRPDDLMLLTLRTSTVLTEDEISLLKLWKAKLLYDNGNMALLHLPVARVNEIAGWQSVLEVR